MDMSLNDIPPQEVEGTQELDTATFSVPQPPVVASQRAFRARFGLADIGPTYEELYGAISGGREQEMRERSASDVNMRQIMNKQNILTSLNKKYPGALSPTDVLEIDRKVKENEKYMDPFSVWEEMYASEAVGQLGKTLAAKQNSAVTEEARRDPKAFEDKMVQGQQFSAKVELVRTEAQNAKSEVESQSMLGYGLDLAKLIVPLYQRVKMTGHTDETSALFGMLGNNLEAQARDLFKLPFSEFKVKFPAVMAQLKKDNPTVAVMWAHAMLGQSTADVFMNNAFEALDVSTLPLATAGKLAMGAGRLTTNAVKDVMKVATKEGVTKSELIAATGDIGEGAIQKAVDNLIRDTKGAPITTEKALESIFTYLKADIVDLKANPGRLTAQEVLNIENKYNALQVNLLKNLTENLRTQRLPDVLASDAAVREINNAIKTQFKGASDNILDMPINFKHEAISNTYFVDINFGAGAGKLFDNEKAAAEFARWNGIKGYQVEQQGAGFMVTVTKPVSEVSDVVRQSLLETSLTSTPDGFYKNFISGLRTSEDTMSVAQRQNRKTVTYGPSNLLKLAQEEAKEISKLMRGSRFRSIEVTDNKGDLVKISKKQAWQDWERVVAAGRKLDDPMNPGEKGYFFKSAQELDDFYLTHIKRLPHIAETEAYFSYKRYLEMDRILRNISVYRNKTRLGVENHNFSSIKDNIKITSPSFDGVLRNTLPGGDDTVLIVGTHMGKERMIRMDRMDVKMKKDLEIDILEGRRRVVELWDPEARPLAGWGDVTDQRVRYVISHTLDTKPLPWEQVPRRGGGHWEYEYENYIKQAKIRKENIGGSIKSWYEGDTTVMPVSLRAMGSDIVAKLNDVRALIHAKDEAGALAKFNEHGIPIPWDEFRGWFKESRDIMGKVQPPRLSADEPFQLVPNGKQISEMSNALETRISGFNDGTKHGSLARQYQVAYTSERDSYDLMTFRDTGTKGNPLYNYEPAKLVDPIPSMHKGLAKIINSVYLDDYKIFSVEHWLKEAQTYLKANASEIKNAPFWHFNNAEYRRGTDPSIIRKFDTQRFQIQQLVGTPTSMDTALHSIAQKLADSAYTALGPKGLALDPDWVLPKLKDPFRFIRAVTYHTTLGMFAIPQLLTQMQTHFTIQAIAGPKFAAPGAYAAQLYHYSKINKNPAIIAKLDEMASGLKLPGADNFKAGQFKEAIEAMERTGFQNVGGEYAALDTMLNTKVVSNGFDNFLDAGTIFFRNGEQNVRYAAWFTAYKEFRAKSPTGRLTDANLQEILNRADLLNINMSRASASAINSGIFSVTTQFLTYQIRLAELFFSQRLGATLMERNMVRARMLATNAALYGAPTATGVFGLPLADFIRQKAVENGYVMGENYVTSLINEGLPSVITAIASGNGDMQKGTFVNIGDKLGTQGFETIKDAMRGDKPWWSILGGAAFSKFSGAFDSMDPFYKWAGSVLRDDNAKTRLTPEDFVAPLKEISSANTFLRTYTAINTGKWLSKKGIFMDDMTSPLGATLLGLTGLQPQKAVDLNILSGSRKDMDNAIKKGTDNFMMHFRRGLLVGKDDPDAANIHFKNALAQLEIYGVPEEKRDQIFARAEEENKSLVSRMNWNYYVTRPMMNKDRGQALDAYSRQLQLEKKQKGY